MAERDPSTDPLVAAGDRRESLDLAPYAEFLRLAREGLPGALVTVIGAEGSAPRGMGAAMAVRGDGSIVGTVGGGSLELLLVAHAREAIEDGRPRRLRYDFSGGPEQNLEKACLGKSEFFVQPTPSPPRLHIFGAGHIGLALAPMAAAAGFLVTLVDDRPGYPPAGLETDGLRIVHGPFDEVIEALTFDERTYGVIVTYGHRQDEAVLRACLPRTWKYLGMIGSQAKVRQVFEAVGVDPVARQRLERVHAPIGLDLGGRSPGEIAISIAAQLQAVRHGRREVRGMQGNQGPA